jgi:hypothetical protein
VPYAAVAAYVGTRSAAQVKVHAQKYFLRLKQVSGWLWRAGVELIGMVAVYRGKAMIWSTAKLAW